MRGEAYLSLEQRNRMRWARAFGDPDTDPDHPDNFPDHDHTDDPDPDKDMP